MTHEEILQALKHCPDHEGCAECECRDFCSDLGELCGYASATIRKQAKDIESMLQRERGLVAELNRTLSSNFYCDVPICCDSEPYIHKNIEQIFSVIHCGIDESKVVRVAVKDDGGRINARKID